MSYVDSIDQPIAPGDWVVYCRSGYARIAKILDIKPTGTISWHNTPEIEMTLMTATDDKTYKRSYKFCPWRAVNKTYSVIRLDRPPAREETLIEQRLARR
jgi:hypothetical protein